MCTFCKVWRTRNIFMSAHFYVGLTEDLHETPAFARDAGAGEGCRAEARQSAGGPSVCTSRASARQASRDLFNYKQHELSLCVHSAKCGEPATFLCRHIFMSA